MNTQLPEVDEESVSLTDTCTNAFDMLVPTGVEEPGKGCLLQIYPARSDSELIRLTKERTLIGRDPSCDIWIDDQAISRIHASIEQLGTSYFLCDLDSTNGTCVDDNQIRGKMPLSGGELIRFGGCILKFMRSMDEEAHYHSMVYELMTRDSLTNAFNRSYLIPMVEKELEKCRKEGIELSLLLLDIDHFKLINDKHGHLVGDEVLRIFCERIRHGLRGNDLLTRFGGEEFVVSSFNTRLKEATRIAEGIRLAISSTPFQTQGGKIAVTCSLGVASSDGTNFSSSDELISAADKQLYSAKNNGRNRVSSFDPHETRQPS